MRRTSVHLVALLTAAAFLASVGCKRDSGTADTKELEARVAKLEASLKRMEEVEAFVRPVMEAQAEDAKRRAASEPDPTARFAVNIEGDNAHGPPAAAVTIIEAWDFA